ncbi:MAG: hypothetical protein NW208_03000 [Bryobacter sp.]|nr:hypothetical protein [Bryobacter sp.]
MRLLSISALLGLMFFVPGRPVFAQAPAKLCAPEANCQENGDFAATITDSSTSKVGSDRILTVNLRFQNKRSTPLILGYVANSGIATDEEGNRYGVYSADAVRGLGEISRLVDPKFQLRAGETANARLEYTWRPRRSEIVGVTWVPEFTVREILPVGQNRQYRLGKEWALKFAPVGRTVGSVAEPPTAVPASAPSTEVSQTGGPVAPLADPCAAKSRCASGGQYFTAEIEDISSSRSPAPRYQHSLRLRVRFQNLTNQPLNLAYHSGTSVVVDDLGQRFVSHRPGTYDTSVEGIGVAARSKVDTKFLLAPGEARSATFTVFRDAAKVFGRTYTFDTTIDRIELLPGGQVRTLGDFSLHFVNLDIRPPSSTGATNGGTSGAQAQSLDESVQKLKDLFKRKKK